MDLSVRRLPQELPLQGGGAGEDRPAASLGVERLRLHLDEGLQGRLQRPAQLLPGESGLARRWRPKTPGRPTSHELRVQYAGPIMKPSPCFLLLALALCAP